MAIRHFVGFWAVLMVALALVLGACGSDDDSGDDSSSGDDGTAATDTSGTEDNDGGDAATDAEELAEDLTESLEETQAAQGGGGATLTVGDRTWEFASVLCAFGEDQIGQEGAVFNLSSIQDGLQLYVSIDSFGHSVTLDDIEDFQNPSVSLEAGSFTGAAEDFVQLDGNQISAAAPFVDDTSDSFEGIDGTLEATCP